MIALMQLIRVVRCGVKFGFAPKVDNQSAVPAPSHTSERLRWSVALNLIFSKVTEVKYIR